MNEAPSPHDRSTPGRPVSGTGEHSHLCRLVQVRAFPELREDSRGDLPAAAEACL